MRDTYKAVEVSAPGVLRVVERPVSEAGARQVRIRVEACGICHTDAATVTGTYPGLKLSRVPGHEVVGRIEALGSGVSRWKIGQRIGVGLSARDWRHASEENSYDSKSFSANYEPGDT